MNHPLTRIDLLRDRAAMLRAARLFFADRNVLEVDCPLITAEASVDAHIDLIPTDHPTGRRYLHSSPEYGMKRLLVEGMGDIYQLAHVFRQEECGARHNPEFMMAEWYRLGFTFKEMIQETFDFARLFLGSSIPTEILSYREAFIRYAQIDPFKSSSQELFAYIQAQSLPYYEGIENSNKDDLLNLILGLVVEPHLGKDSLTALAYYPASQAALAQIQVQDRELVAERFELYYRGIELANGYHELACADEQRARFAESNAERVRLGKEKLPADEKFLKALRIGLPECCGVAVGVDRLLMLRHNKSAIACIMPFAWEEA